MQDISNEAWRAVPGFDGMYDVSDQGRVRSWVPWRNTPLPRLLTANKSVRGTGHWRIQLANPGGRGTGHQRWLVHRLVMLAFVGTCPESMEVCHTDGNPDNNTLCNLRYDTRHENIMDAVRLGTWGPLNNRKTHCSHGHEYTPENTYYHHTSGRQCRACLSRRSREWHQSERGREARRARRRKAA